MAAFGKGTYENATQPESKHGSIVCEFAFDQLVRKFEDNLKLCNMGRGKGAMWIKGSNTCQSVPVCIGMINMSICQSIHNVIIIIHGMSHDRIFEFFT